MATPLDAFKYYILKFDARLRKEIKIRPGFTPQEDVNRFRGTKQSAMDSRALPKGHIIGWAPPPTSIKPAAASGALSKNQKKNQKKKDKREAEVSQKIKDSWEDDDDEDEGGKKSAKASTPSVGGSGTPKDAANTADRPSDADGLADKLEKLGVH